ncbi:MAG: hypothetical protein IT245_01430 [Bacteroidia bacterium]|nr:hypothetical protein [Bacteroidia bacterium]
MFNEKLKKQIIEVWNNHVSAIKTDKDEEGNAINTIDDSRLHAIEVVKIIMQNFLKGDFNVLEFKNALDSYNKHNNLWGFTARMGQMYFNLLIKTNEQNIDKLTLLLRELIVEPRNLRDALSKIDTLEKFTQGIYSKAKDKHNAPYPGAVGFFLSYFWQMYNHQKWPILYNTLMSAFKELGVWEDQKTQKETYEAYYRVYNEIKDTVEEVSTRIISFWDIEHAFWNFKLKPVHKPIAVSKSNEAASPIAKTDVTSKVAAELHDTKEPNEAIDIREYIIPRLSRLLEEEQKQADTPANLPNFASMVAETFAQLDFDVLTMDTKGYNNPLAVLKFREENIAFLVDAQEDSNDYFNIDRRIVKDYINNQCQILRREGYKKIGYFVISKNFESHYQDFVSYIQWNTEVKKMTLLSAEALLYILAYKIKHRAPLISLIEKVSGFSMQVGTHNIANELDS